MTLKEFKAWFEGFTEGMEAAPTAKQWARIKERVGEIDGAPVTERVYIDRYWPPSYPYWSSSPWVMLCGSGGVQSTGYNSMQQASGVSAYNAGNGSTDAMYLAGKADQGRLSGT